MRALKLLVGTCVFALAIWAQSDRGTITGTVADPAGAVVSGAAIEDPEHRDRGSLSSRDLGDGKLHAGAIARWAI